MLSSPLSPPILSPPHPIPSHPISLHPSPIPSYSTLPKHSPIKTLRSNLLSHSNYELAGRRLEEGVLVGGKEGVFVWRGKGRGAEVGDGGFEDGDGGMDVDGERVERGGWGGGDVEGRGGGEVEGRGGGEVDGEVWYGMVWYGMGAEVDVDGV